MSSTSFLQTAAGCVHEISLSHGLPLSLFLAGLVGGFTHCTAMCGPFVLAQSEGQIQKMSKSLLLPYHLGRITTYIAMAMVFASLLNVAFLFLPVRALVVAPLLMTAGLIFILTAFPSVGRFFPWLVNLQLFVPYRWLEKIFTHLSTDATVLKRYALGLLLGFMPCGMIVSALMAASTAPSALEAGFAMAAFGVGTVPALVLVAFGGQALQGKYPVFARRARQVMLVWSGLWLFLMAGFMLV